MQSWPRPNVPQVPGQPPVMRLFDTSSGAIEEVKTTDRASIYVCGITPYDATHLGHASTYVTFDLLIRQWLDAGLEVNYIQNVTDIDDPLLERAEATGVDWEWLAEDQTNLFRGDMEALRVIPPHHYMGAVAAIPWVVEGVEKMLADGVAYRVDGTDGEPDGDVYFDSAAAASDAWRLGDVSHYDAETMNEFFAERGGDPKRPGKRDPLDPLLWRVAREGEPSWDGGTLGDGRPGWHIECSVMAARLNDGPLTVQAGGNDLIFPHHEFSAGHTAAVSGHRLADHYAHTGMVGLEGVKMSKSLGNLVLVSKLMAAGRDPRAIRAVILDHHYRDDWSFEHSDLDRADQRLAAWEKALGHTSRQQAEDVVARIRTALANDLDAPAALLALDEWAAAADASAKGADAADAEAAGLVADAVNALLGIELKPAQS